MHPCVRLLFRFVLKAFLCARIGLFLPQAVYRPSPRECNHPAERFALLRGEIFGLIPDFHENLLQEVVGLGFTVNDTQDQRFKNTVVTIVEL